LGVKKKTTSTGQKQLAETLKELMIPFNMFGKELIFNEIKEMKTLPSRNGKMGDKDMPPGFPAGIGKQ